ncbi:MAG: hypothetical protein IKI66_04210 [Bacteroidales bacterium]|nr:hypothetical protein [Bacteroidales bacterium]
MTVKQQLQLKRAALLRDLDEIEKQLINTPAEELDRENDTDADDAAFAAELKRDGKLTPPKPGEFQTSNR